MVPIVVPAFIALWEIRRDKRKRGLFLKYGLLILVFVTTGAACWLSWSDYLSAKAAEKREPDSGSQMTRIEGRLGSEDATKSYLAINRQLTRQLTNATSGTAIERFFATASERSDTRKTPTEGGICFQ